MLKVNVLFISSWPFKAVFILQLKAFSPTFMYVAETWRKSKSLTSFWFIVMTGEHSALYYQCHRKNKRNLNIRPIVY